MGAIEHSTSVSTLGSTARVAVVVVNFNGKATLQKCLNSIRGQTWPPYRVIVVDNDSTDGSAVEAVSLFPDYEFFHLPENKGFAFANNIAAKMASDCDWLALLNPDAYAAPDWLEALCRALEVNREYGFFGSRMLMDSDPERLDGVGDIYHISGLAWRHGHGKPASGFADMAVEIFAPCAAAAMYRREAFLAIAGFDEDFFCYMEDVDLGFRLRLRGVRCLYVPQAVVRHEGSATTGGRHSDFSVYYGHRNLVWVFVKNMPTSLLWLLPLHLLMNMAAVVRFLALGQGKVICRAKLDAVKGLPKMLVKRREIQKYRHTNTFDIWRLMNKQIGLWK